jgi:membrane protease YdiL (CAAX protease family)
MKLPDTLVPRMNSTQPTRDCFGASDDGNAASPEPPHPCSRDFNIILDSDGLRPIWAIALFLLVWELLRQLVFPLFEAIFPTPFSGSIITARHAIAFESAALLCVAIPTWLMGRLEGRTVAAYGFKRRHATRNFVLGLASGAILLSALVAILRASGLLVFDARLLLGSHMLRAGLIWAAGFLLVAFAEEMLLRGYLQFALARALNSIFSRLLSPPKAESAGFWIAAITLSITFGYSHSGNSGESPLGLVDAALVGLVFCLSLWRTGSLWWAIGFHAAWDWAQSFLYGVADSGLMMQSHLFATHPAGRPILSGGLTGPEGSVFLFPIILVACVVIVLTLPNTRPGTTPATAPAAALDLP